MYNTTPNFRSVPSGAVQSETLFARTMFVLTLLCSVTIMSSLLAWNWVPTGWSLFGVCTCTLILAAWSGSTREKKKLDALIPGLMLGIAEGALLGPVFHLYVKRLGPQTVLFALAVSVGIMAVFGAIGYFLQIARKPLESIAFIGLIGLILYGAVTLMSGLPPLPIDNGYCILGIVIFVVFFLVDFNRLREEQAQGESSWGTAAFLAVSVYLDLLNVLLFVLRLFSNNSETKD